MKPLISILIPCYNAERWIASAIESALAQTWPEKEVMVVDDGSTDKSLDVIKSFGDKIRWESGPNRGGNAARNRLLKLARGEWLQYLDADDYLRPEKVTRQAEFLAAHPDAEILFSPHTLERYLTGGTSVEDTVVPDPCDIWVLFARWFLPGTGSGIWSRQAVVEAGGWDEEQPCCQEHELYLRLLMAGKKFRYCRHGGYIYRHWGENTVSKRNKRETHVRRLAIVRRAEDFLRQRNELTPERLQAINQGRFETARMAWLYDPEFASQIIETIRHSQPAFVPDGQAAPAGYQVVYRTFGFQAAEQLAAWKRRLMKPTV
jgi:glycosyltransferase involved in cell wall biosynthesis